VPGLTASATEFRLRLQSLRHPSTRPPPWGIPPPLAFPPVATEEGRSYVHYRTLVGMGRLRSHEVDVSPPFSQVSAESSDC
jgi:hypothetical protein